MKQLIDLSKKIKQVLCIYATGGLLLLFLQDASASEKFKNPFAREEQSVTFPPMRAGAPSTKGLDPPDSVDDADRTGAAIGDALGILLGGAIIYGFYLRGIKQEQKMDIHYTSCGVP
jgi:hypothetical protein